MPIVWKEKMSVGNTIIDDEHKLLICLLNSVEIALQVENHADMVRFLVKELHQYTRNHFFQEEKIMKDRKYPDLENHKKEHKAILEQISELEVKLENTENSDSGFKDLEADIASMLRSWIIDHVIKTDLKMKPYM